MSDEHADLTDDEPGSTAPGTSRPGLADQGLQPVAVRAAGVLKVAARVLAAPSVLVAAAAAVGLLVMLVLAVTGLAIGMLLSRWVLLGLTLAGLVGVGVFVTRVWRTVRASRDPEVLGSELIGLVDLEALTAPMIADLAELASREGGIRAVSRARALWRVLRRLDVEEHVTSFERARWFVPPDVSLTWVYAQVATWGGLAAWVLIPMVALGRVRGWV